MKVRKILLGTNEVAGVGTALKQAFLDLGYEVDFPVYYPHPFEYGGPRFVNRVLQKKVFLKSLLSFDTFIFLFGCSLLIGNGDLPCLRLFKKNIVSIFLGCDIRDREAVLKEKRPFSACSLCEITECSTGVKRTMAEKFEKYSSLILSQPEYSQLLKRNYDFLYMPIIPENYEPSCPENDLPLVVHAPSNRKIKGTEHILKAVETLKSEGLKFQFTLLENLANSELLDKVKMADIVIDQLLAGWHGFFAVEAMALGKPVLCYLRDEYRAAAPDIPIISAHPENIAGSLRTLLEKPQKRKELGRLGREYVEKHHDARRIARRIIERLETKSHQR
jgi:glycosyltransferase involved in cell wall biosynthesis